MKKILFILLSTISIYGQTTTGKETKFINGIRNQASQVISDPTNLVTQGTDGTQGVVTASTYKDVLKYATASAFPLTGVVGKLYYAIDTDLYYKWDGATYEEFGAGGTETDPLALKIASNLSDLASVSTARTNLGLGTLATQNGTFISPSIVPLDEGGGIGHVINGRTSANYGNIGLYATDLSFSDATSSVRGATGQSSFTTGTNTRASSINAVALNGTTIASGINSLATGNSTTASNQEATAMGGFTTSSGHRSMAVNSSNTASGYASFVANENNTSPSYGETVIGVNATNYTPSSATTFNSGDRQFTVGIGASSGARADGLQVMKNGIVTTPSLTQALIDADATGKILTTKEWVQANTGGSGSTNLSTTYAPTTVTIVSSSGTDATVNAVDGTNAGVVTPTQKADWDAKQTASQVQTIADAKVTQTITNGVTTTAPSEDAVFDALETKQPLATVLTNTTASFTTADETKLDGIATGANVGVVPNASITGATKTKITYDSKGLVTSGADASLNDLSDVNITSPTTDQVLVYDGLGDFRNGSLTTGSISDFNSATRAQTEAELVSGTNITITPSGTGATRQLTIASTASTPTQGAYTVLANNTASTATPTEQVFKSMAEQTYSGTITWTSSTAPSGATNHNYSWAQVGKLVTLTLNLAFATGGTGVTAVAIDLPSDLPTPRVPTGVADALDVITYGTGSLASTNQQSAGATSILSLRLKTTSTYELYLTRSSGNYGTVYVNISYFAQ